jgi:diguanylate cyclase (GGDEF)-like protein/PAS domain S-box-containing protein
MTKLIPTMADKAALRKRAEDKLAQNRSLNTTDEDKQKLLHELQVHQIELEMQNEALIEARAAESIALMRFTELFDFAPVAYCTLDRVSMISAFNLNGADMLGVAHYKLVGKRLASFIDNDYLATWNTSLAKVFDTGERVRCELHLNKSANALWVQAEFKLDHTSNLCLVALIDITERKQNEKIRLSAAALESLSEGVLVVDMHGIILAINASFTRLTGYSAAEVIGQSARIMRSGRQNKTFYANMWFTLNATGKWEGEICNRRKNGQEYYEWLAIATIYDAHGDPIKRVGTFSDITEKKRNADIIEQQANFDSLTGLPNRRLFHDRLAQGIKKSQRTGQRLALLSLDLDKFKDINDSLGHVMGDVLLVEVAARITHCIRDIDTASRLGGDEFTVIIGELDNIENVERVAECILNTLAAPFYLGSNVGYVSASIGIVIFPEDGTDNDTLVKNADQAMYAAKNEGRNRMRYFTSAMQLKVQNRFSLSSELRNALANHQFRMAYQPIIELATGQLHKAEALIRWQHPQLGLVSPAEFIPIAEETGLIVSIGEWVFQQATQQTAKWRNTFCADFQISINKSPIQFRNDRINYVHWLKYLQEIGLDTQGIVIEITEGLLMDASEQIMHQLKGLSEAGIDISLDDFGTGYSSLAYLKKFHVNYLKIDQSFVKGLASDADSMALCEAIVVMAHKLGLKVIAEGVETSEQHDLLLSMGCDYGQGYLFSKPVAAEAFEKLFVKN